MDVANVEVLARGPLLAVQLLLLPDTRTVLISMRERCVKPPLESLQCSATGAIFRSLAL